MNPFAIRRRTSHLPSHRPTRPARHPARPAPRWAAGAALALALLAAPPSQAQSERGLSAASGLSLLPVALVVAAPAAVLSGATVLTLTAVEASADGGTWVLERGSDGARISLRVAGGASVAVGAAVTVTAVGAGWLLSSAGRVLAIVPNELGRGLLHHERVSR